MLGAEERRLRRTEQYAADDALMVYQAETFPVVKVMLAVVVWFFWISLFFHTWHLAS